MAKKLFQKGNPGRKKGARNKRTIEIEKLRGEFITAIYCDRKIFRRAFRIALMKKPVEALKVVASVLPKDVKINDGNIIPIQLIDPEEKNI